MGCYPDAFLNAQVQSIILLLEKIDFYLGFFPYLCVYSIRLKHKTFWFNLGLYQRKLKNEI